MDVAIVGMACRLPGADDYRQFWANLCAATDSVSEIPADRWDAAAYYGDPQAKNRSQSKWGGFLADAARFDAAFFGISPREAERMDPQQRFMLELAWQCIEDAGYRPSDLSGRNIGVYVGASTYDYKELQEDRCTEVVGHTATGVYNCVIPNRVSYFFNLHGPSILVDTACSSSLVAVHQAVHAIRTGECAAALAGGVSLLATPTSFISFGKVGMLSPTGACRAFDAAADGYVRGEGGGLIFLKPLARALADGDEVLAVIKGTAVNHGGRARSLTAPNAIAQSKVIVAALRQAEVSPATVGYVETHGTGTPLGDPIEVHGLLRAFRQGARGRGETPPRHYCGLGAVKTNIGHLEAAAGIASVIKLVLAMRHRTLPGNAHFTRLNPRIDLADTPFYVLQERREWMPLTTADGTPVPLRAGVSSFGYGGANSHIVLEQGPALQPPAIHERYETPTTHLLTLSAHSDDALQRLVADYIGLLRADPDHCADICREANTTRTPMSRRIAVVAGSCADMIETLDAYTRGTPAGARVKRRDTQGTKPSIGFLFTGQGAQYVGMGKALYAASPVFRDALNHCDRLLAPELGCSVVELMRTGEATMLGCTRYTQPVLFALEYALATLWRALGIKPDVVIGHSVGEIVAACVAGVFSLEDGLRLAAHRGRLMDSVAADGAMAAIELDADETERFLAASGLTLDIAADNAPRSTVISGAREPLERALALLADAGIESRRLDVSQAFHSVLMEPIQSAFLDAIRDVSLCAPTIKIVSNVTGRIAGAEMLDPTYWVDHIRKPVRFRQGIEQMRQAGVAVFLEIGPSAVLTNLGRRTVTEDVSWLSSLTPKSPDTVKLLDALGELYTLGFDIDFSPLYRHLPRRRIALPPYPFGGERYWITPHAATAAAPAELFLDARHPLLGRRLNLAARDTTYYAASVQCDELGYLGDHCVNGDAVLPGAAYLEMALAAAREAGGDAPLAVEDVKFHRPLVLTQNGVLQTLLQRTDDPSRFTFEVWSSFGAVDSGPTPWVLHASGRCAAGAASDDTADVPPDADDGESVEPAAFYARMTGYGLAYGPGFQGVRALRARHDCGVAEVALAPGVAGAGTYVCHPALLDGVFQSALPLLPADAFRNGLLPLPVAVGSVCLRAPLPEQVRVMARLVASDNRGGEYRCDYRLYDLDGAPLGEITGLTLKRVSLTASHTDTELKESASFFYQPVWQRQPLALDVSAEPVPEVVLLVYTPEGVALAHALARRMPARDIVRVCLDPHALLTLGDAYRVDPTDPAAFADILAAHASIDHIYFLGGFHIAPRVNGCLDQATQVARLETAQNLGVLCLFHLIKALAPRLDRGLRITIATNHSYAVADNDRVVPWGAATSGLASVLCNEHPEVKVVNVDLDLAADADEVALDFAAARLALEPASAPGGIVAYRRQHRYFRRLDPVRLSEPERTVYRENGVYFILGGAGGIGLALSLHLAAHYRARLAWVGRSPLDETKRRAIAEIERLGGQVVYFQADGGDVDALHHAVSTATERFGRLNGVVHSALVLRDQSLFAMDIDTLRAGLDPKVRATWALWRAVQHEPLDFFLFFSSVVAFLPNRGQANYVAGCAFKDSFAHYLRNNHGVPVKIVNWGRWRGIGAVADDAHERRLDAQGIGSLDPEQGIAAIAAALAAPAPQLVALKADAAVLDRIGVDLGSEAHWIAPRAAVNVAAWRDIAAPAFDLPAPVQTFHASYGALNRLAAALVWRVLHDMLGDVPLATIDTTAALRSQLGLAPAHERLYRACLDMLERAGMWRIVDGRISADPARRARDWTALADERAALVADCPWLAAEVRLLWACGQQLAPVLRGEIPATQVLFPDLSMKLVEDVYSATPLARYYNERVADAVQQALTTALANDPAAKLRILEIGAGTGGTTRVVLDRLQRSDIDVDVRIEYLYTDVSAAFLKYGKEQYGADRPFLTFGLLDIERPVETQGYTPGDFDVVFAANVLHATRDLARTLQHVKCLLKRGGALILHELVQRQDFLTLSFGLLEGWWLAEDGHKRVAHSPVLTRDLWREVLREEGFPVVIEAAAADAARDAEYLGVIVGESDGRVRNVRARRAPIAAVPTAPVRRDVPAVADIVAALRTAPPETLRRGLFDYLRHQLADVLHARDAQFENTSRPLAQMLLSELGVDSLTAMDLRNRLRKDLALHVPVEKLLGGASVQAVVDLLHEQALLNRLIDERPARDAAAGEDREDMETFVL